MDTPLIFEKSAPQRIGFSLPENDVPKQDIKTLLPKNAIRKREANLPEVTELDAMRHFISLSIKNHHVDKGFYPLGSCTMKYNPKINEDVARLPGIYNIHPMQPESVSAGALRLMGELSEYLCEITGLDDVTLQPAAGAHGEMTGIKMIRAYHEKKGNPRQTIILPDSAHGTNPASATISGYSTVQIKSTAQGLVDIDDLKNHLDDSVAAFMLTNPNTLGLFETQICQIAELVHDAGALLYMDGANLNALLGIVRPGDFGVDVLHINLHKTFSTPHGGGGPGSGPVAVRSILTPFLPKPAIEKNKSSYQFQWDMPDSIGKVHSFWGQFGVMVKAYAYIRMLGSRGLCRVAQNAILNANYLMRQLQGDFDLPHAGHHMHEFVLSGDRQKALGVKTLDMAKRLLDEGFHAPTVYFPLIVHEALMIEPTETESREVLDAFADTLIQIAKEAATNPEKLLEAPVTTPVSRLDEGLAARELNVRYQYGSSG